MAGQDDESMLRQDDEDKSPNPEEDVPDEDIVGVIVGPLQARNSVVRYKVSTYSSFFLMRQGGTSTIATIFLIVNAALGAGLLNFPKAFDQAGGVLVAVLVQVAS